MRRDIKFWSQVTNLHNFTWTLSCHPPVSLPPTLNRSQELQELYGSVPSLGTFTGNPTNDQSKGPVSFMWGGEGGVVTLTRPCIITHHRYAPGPGIIITQLCSSQDTRRSSTGGVSWWRGAWRDQASVGMRHQRGGSGGGDRRLGVLRQGQVWLVCLGGDE